MSSVPERSDIDETYKWKLEDLYASDEEWEQAYKDVQAKLDELSAYEGQVTDDADTLYTVLQLREEIMRTVENVASYARMRRDEDTTDGQYQALNARAQSLSSDAQSAASFITPELQTLDREDIDELIDAEPDLAVYDHYFDDVLRMKKHTRSAEIENLLAELGEVTGAPGEVYNMLANADMEFPAVELPETQRNSDVQATADADVETDAEQASGDDDTSPTKQKRITLNNFTTLQKHPDRAFRKEVYEVFYDEWETVRNTVGAAYKNSVKTDSKLAQARNYDTAREAALDDPNIPPDVYDNLINTVRDNLDKLHRYADLKRQSIGADELQMWDLYVPMTDGESPDIPYEQACEYVTEAVAPLGDEYQSRLAEGLESRWVDVYETDGKQSGAYSGGTYDSQPYILMNYQDDVESMYTLAHELGHSMHSELTSETQPYVYSGYEIFVAEVASTVNETLLTQHLLETVDDETLRQHVLNEYLERFRSTLYRQTMFAEFEHRAHELSEAGEALTPDRLDELYLELKSDYYEPATIDDRIEREWMRIPHFYRAFYVFQYATGISAAVALVDDILNEGEPAAQRYIEFLQKGSREYPLELLQGAGVDMTSPEPVEAALETYDDYLDEFAALL